MRYVTEGAGSPVEPAEKVTEAPHTPALLLTVMLAGHVMAAGTCGVNCALISPDGIRVV